jgi:hypothetical protein
MLELISLSRYLANIYVPRLLDPGDHDDFDVPHDSEERTRNSGLAGHDGTLVVKAGDWVARVRSVAKYTSDWSDKLSMLVVLEI